MYKCSFITHENTKGLNHLYVPEAIMTNILSDMTLKLGTSYLKVKCLQSDTASIVRLETCESFFFSLPEMKNVFISIDPVSHTLTIGPIVTVLTNYDAAQNLNTHPLKDYFTECQTWFQRKGGFFYLLPVSSFLKGKSEGLVYDSEKWNLQPLPAPDLIYNRNHSRKLEKQSAFKNALNRFEEDSGHLL